MDHQVDITYWRLTHVDIFAPLLALLGRGAQLRALQPDLPARTEREQLGERRLP
jgi:hypothetical protein